MTKSAIHKSHSLRLSQTNGHYVDLTTYFITRTTPLQSSSIVS